MNTLIIADRIIYIIPTILPRGRNLGVAFSTDIVFVLNPIRFAPYFSIIDSADPEIIAIKKILPQLSTFKFRNLNSF